jgi:hypothetical protein
VARAACASPTERRVGRESAEAPEVDVVDDLDQELVQGVDEPRAGVGVTGDAQ